MQHDHIQARKTYTAQYLQHACGSHTKTNYCNAPQRCAAHLPRLELRHLGRLLLEEAPKGPILAGHLAPQRARHVAHAQHALCVAQRQRLRLVTRHRGVERERAHRAGTHRGRERRRVRAVQQVPALHSAIAAPQEQHRGARGAPRRGGVPRAGVARAEERVRRAEAPQVKRPVAD